MLVNEGILTVKIPPALPYYAYFCLQKGYYLLKYFPEENMEPENTITIQIFSW